MFKRNEGTFVKEGLKMPTNGLLTDTERELIAIGASVAAGCRPCTAYHFRAARASGADEEEMRRAVDDALCVRQSAAKVMAGWAEKHLGGVSESDAARCSEKPLIGELVSIGAALAINCVTNLETHVAAARRLGATDAQIQTTLGIARAVKNMAGRKVEAAAERVAPQATWAGEDCADDCGCHAEKSRPTRAAKEFTGCGCGEAGAAVTNSG